MAVRSSELHNNHNVYILGAGFSKPRGLPLISDFMLQMRDALEYHTDNSHLREARAIEEILDFRLKASSAAYRVQIDLENIEELFSLASASNGQMDIQMRLAIAATLDYALAKNPDVIAQFSAPKKWSDFNLRNWKSGDEFGTTGHYWTGPGYEFIANALIGSSNKSKTENSFITFNYDTVLEDALRGLGVNYSLGLDENTSLRGDYVTQVLKLHGSVDWAIPKGGRSRVETFTSYRSLVDQDLIPFIIPPTWKKDTKAGIGSVWSNALTALKNATRIVVIGFSIPPSDMHFKYLLAAGLQDNFSLREIVFINPEAGKNEIKERCESLFSAQFRGGGLKLIGKDIQGFVGQGYPDTVYSIGRPMSPDVQGVNFSRKAK